MNRKALSLPILISLSVGNMIGTGIYVLPATLAQFGTMALLAWIFSSIGALLLALVFASMNKRFPKTGGAYIYCKEAFGKPFGFVIAYTYWMCYVVSVAAIAIATTGYLGFIFPLFDANRPEYNLIYTLWVELGFVWFFTAINLIGVHNAGVVQVILTVIKVLPLIFISIIGLYRVDLQNLAQATFHQQVNFSSLGSATAITFWAFIGLETATVPAENSRGPRDIFIATVFGTLGTGILYIISTFVLMGMISPDQLAKSQFPFATAGTMLFGSYAALFVAVCAIASGLGSLNSCVLVQAEIVYAAARDGLFPKIFTKLSKKDVPYAGQLLSAGIISLLLIFSSDPSLLKQFNNVAMLATLLTMITYFATALAEFKFSFQPKLKRIRRRATTVAFLASLFALWSITNFSIPIIFVAVTIMGICLPIYYFGVRSYA